MASKDTKNASMGTCEPTESETNHSNHDQTDAFPIAKMNHHSFAAKENSTPKEKQQTFGPSPTNTKEKTMENSAAAKDKAASNQKSQPNDAEARDNPTERTHRYVTGEYC
ncbi:hypothetical protein SEMRO_2089_G313930.1 [Seminavis robusta]|uniref:Uncharacterized protein n=1 Tax=Seminavis robusta TaxID=568900 RepID=A0A9N8EY73_9STRA|nr:hypothetical protein SEMRO_2089_G313930.1 [Seminavis robusta]|eukprot:Sro2089_g313930.1 n/a (110) ;mRNA; r:1686-2015